MSIIDIAKFVTRHPLNRNRKVTSLFRFLLWQIRSRLYRGDAIVDWIGNAKFYARGGESGITGNIYTGLHEYTDMSLLLHVMRPGDYFVDVGANVGSYTILASAVVGADSIAIEPVPSTFKRLEQNVSLNHIEERVRRLNMGVGDVSGKIKFTSHLDTVNHAVADGEDERDAIDVEVSRLDDILENVLPVFMKIDVEGFEVPALQGSFNILEKKSLKVVIIELNGSGMRYGFDDDKVLELMHGHGFATYAYDPLKRSLSNISGKCQESGNTIFVRDEDFVSERIRTSPVYTVHGIAL